MIPKHWIPIDESHVVFRATEKKEYARDAVEVEVPLSKYTHGGKVNNDCTTNSETNFIQVILKWNGKVEDLDLYTNSETCMSEVR